MVGGAEAAAALSEEAEDAAAAACSVLRLNCSATNAGSFSNHTCGPSGWVDDEEDEDVAPTIVEVDPPDPVPPVAELPALLLMATALLFTAAFYS